VDLSIAMLVHQRVLLIPVLTAGHICLASRWFQEKTYPLGPSRGLQVVTLKKRRSPRPMGSNDSNDSNVEI
jgi:hypothetical protein